MQCRHAVQGWIGSAGGCGGLRFLQVPPTAPSTSCPPTAPMPAADPAHELVWRGSLRVPGMFTGRHYFRLELADGGACRLVHGEDFSGLLLPLMGGLLTDTKRGFHAMNGALKARAEARAGASQ